jgi:uncharacterized protein YegP (UPF0339 family)
MSPLASAGRKSVRLLPPLQMRTYVPIRTGGNEMPQFDAFEDLVGKWRWRLLGADGRTVATAGESFDTHWHALRAAENVRGTAAGALISGTPAEGAADPLGTIIDRELARS